MGLLCGFVFIYASLKIRFWLQPGSDFGIPGLFGMALVGFFSRCVFGSVFGTLFDRSGIHFGPILDQFWGHVLANKGFTDTAFLGSHGFWSTPVPLGTLGALLAPSWALLGPSWHLLEPS